LVFLVRPNNDCISPSPPINFTVIQNEMHDSHEPKFREYTQIGRGRFLDISPNKFHTDAVAVTAKRKKDL
jgi:hypothetical protein